MNLDNVIILTIGVHCWGKGKTLKEALDNMAKEGGSGCRRKYIAFLTHEDSYVDEMGSIQYPNQRYGQLKPREIHRVGIKKKDTTYV